jgi:peptide deformylase
MGVSRYLVGQERQDSPPSDRVYIFAAKNMKVIAPHRVNSIPVGFYSQIKEEVEKIVEIVNGKFEGIHTSCLGLHASQLFPKPYNYFVLSDEGKKYLGERVIINPKIVEKDKSTKYQAKEGCMSYPFRPFTKLTRYGTIKVEYDTKVFIGDSLKKHKKELKGLAAEIFQHEVDHANGKYIYD